MVKQIWENVWELRKTVKGCKWWSNCASIRNTRQYPSKRSNALACNNIQRWKKVRLVITGNKLKSTHQTEPCHNNFNLSFPTLIKIPIRPDGYEYDAMHYGGTRTESSGHFPRSHVSDESTCSERVRWRDPSIGCPIGCRWPPKRVAKMRRNTWTWVGRFTSHLTAGPRDVTQQRTDAMRRNGPQQTRPFELTDHCGFSSWKIQNFGWSTATDDAGRNRAIIQ